MKKIELIKSTGNVSNRDLINARTSVPLKDVVGQQIEAVKAFTFKQDDLLVFCFQDDEGEYYSTISSAIIEVSDFVIDEIDSQGRVALTCTSHKSNSGRDFLLLRL